MPGRHAPAHVRFWRHVHKTDTCWLWTASANSSGYGQFKAVSGRGVSTVSPARRKFADEQARAVRERYTAGGVSMQELALVHGVNKSSIVRLINGQHYAEAASPTRRSG